MGERFFEAFGVSVDNTLFKGEAHGDLNQPIRTWRFDIDPVAHPYINMSNVPKLKDILIKLDVNGE